MENDVVLNEFKSNRFEKICYGGDNLLDSGNQVQIRERFLSGTTIVVRRELIQKSIKDFEKRIRANLGLGGKGSHIQSLNGSAINREVGDL